MKKYLFLFLVGLTAASMFSCKKEWLEPAPENTLVPTDSTFADPQNAEKFVTACYSQMNDWGQNVFSWIGMSSITSDDADKGSDPGDLGTDKDQMDNLTYSPTNLSPSEVWFANYTGIGRCNQAILNVPLFTNVDQATKDRLVGEAKFLRAYFYFNLVRSFGDVPKVDKVIDATSSEELNKAFVRAPKQEIYDLIVADLTEAASVLPGKNSAILGRATKGAAQALLAKAYLYQSKWQEAFSAAEAVINSGEYGLEPDFSMVFRQSTEHGTESIFEIEGQNGGEGWSTGGFFVVQGARGTVEGGYGGWGFNSPTEDLENAFEAGDKRKEGTIYYAGQTLWDGAIVGTDVANPRYNYKAYVSQTQESNFNDWSSGKNIRVIRFAEVLLIHAEAAVELGKTSDAVASINKLRSRAGLANTTASSQGDLRNAVYHERRVEMAMEGDRFFDLIRTGRAEAVLNAHGKNFVAGKHEVFPVPQNQIDISQGKLEQNPGY